MCVFLCVGTHVGECLCLCVLVHGKLRRWCGHFLNRSRCSPITYLTSAVGWLALGNPSAQLPKGQAYR